MKNPIFITGEYYHIYNRGTDKRRIFMDLLDIERFVQSMIEFNDSMNTGSLYEKDLNRRKWMEDLSKPDPIISPVAYCLNINHFHFLVRQDKDSGISDFMQKLGIGYTKYFNTRTKRSGALFQGKFKAVQISNNNQLLKLSVYVNLNDKIHSFFRSKDSGRTEQGFVSVNSWNEYTEQKGNMCDKDIILGQFKNADEYKKCALDLLPILIDKKRIDKELEALCF